METLYRELHENLSYIKQIALNGNAATRGNEVVVLKSIERRLRDHFGELAHDLKLYSSGPAGAFYANLLGGSADLHPGGAADDNDEAEEDSDPDTNIDVKAAAGDGEEGGSPTGQAMTGGEDAGSAAYRSDQVASLLSERVALLAFTDMLLDTPPSSNSNRGAAGMGPQGGSAPVTVRDPALLTSSDDSGADDENAGLLPRERSGGVRRRGSRRGARTDGDLFSRLYGDVGAGASSASTRVTLTEYASYSCQQLCSQATTDTASSKAVLECILGTLRLSCPHIAAVHCESLAHAAAVASESAAAILGYDDGSSSSQTNAMGGGGMPEIVRRLGAFSTASFSKQEDLPPVNKDMLLVVANIAIGSLQAFHSLKKHETLQSLCIEIIAEIVQSCSFIVSADELRVPTVLVQGLLLPIAMSERGAGQTLQGAALTLLGHLCHCYPLAMVGSAQSIWAAFVAMMQRLRSKSTPEMTLGKGLLDGLRSYMIHFSVSVADAIAENTEATARVGSSRPLGGQSVASASAALGELRLLYSYLRSTLSLASQDTTHRYHMVHAALEFLHTHGLLLKEFLLEDAVGLFDALVAVCGHKNVTLHKKAYPTANAVLRIVALEMCEGAGTLSSDEKRRAVLSQLLERCYTLLQSSVKYELSFAVSACGCLARPVRVYGSPVSPTAASSASPFLNADSTLQQLLNVLVSKIEGMLTRTRDDLEEAARHFPQFLSAIASLLLETDSGGLPASTALSIGALLDAMLLLYPKAYYFPKMRMYTAPAVLQLLFALSLRHGPYSPEAASIPSRFLRTALMCTAGSSAMFKEGRDELLKRCAREDRRHQSNRAQAANTMPNSSAGRAGNNNRLSPPVAADGISYHSWPPAALGTQMQQGGPLDELSSNRADAPIDDGDVEGALYEEYLPLWTRLLRVPRRQRGAMLLEWGYPWTTLVWSPTASDFSGSPRTTGGASFGSALSLRSSASSQRGDMSASDRADSLVAAFVTNLQETLLGCVLEFINEADLGCSTLDAVTANFDDTPASTAHRAEGTPTTSSAVSYASAPSVITSLSISSTGQRFGGQQLTSGSQSSLAETLWLEGGDVVGSNSRSRLVSRERLLSGVTAVPASSAHHAKFTATNAAIAPTNPVDYTIFLNTVSFFQRACSMLFQGVSSRWVAVMLKNVLERAASHPHVSGLFTIVESLQKLLQQRTPWTYNACARSADSSFSPVSSGQQTQHSRRQVGESKRRSLISILGRGGMFSLWAFLQRTAQRLPDMSDELLVAACKCVVAMPRGLIVSVVASECGADKASFLEKAHSAAKQLLVTPITTLVELGAMCPDAGEAALNALEVWLSSSAAVSLADSSNQPPEINSIDPAFLLAERIQTDLTLVVLRRVGLYISGSSSGQEDATEETLQEKHERRRREGFLDRLARLIGQEGLRLAVSLGQAVSDDDEGIASTGPPEGLSSTTVDASSAFTFVDYSSILKLELPLGRDVKAGMPLHRLLPRILHLARQDTTLADDRRPRVAAAELLHATVLLLIGKGSAASSSKDASVVDAFGELFSKLLPHVVYLASSEDPMVQELFNSLLLQIAHWCGSGGSEQSFLVDAFIGAVFDGVFASQSKGQMVDGASASSSPNTNRIAGLRSASLAALSEFHDYSNGSLPAVYAPESEPPSQMTALHTLHRRLGLYMCATSTPSATSAAAGRSQSSNTHWLAALVFNRLYTYFSSVGALVERYSISYLTAAIAALEDLSERRSTQRGEGGQRTRPHTSSNEQQEAACEQLEVMVKNLEKVLMLNSHRFLVADSDEAPKSAAVAENEENATAAGCRNKLEGLVGWLLARLMASSSTSRPTLMRLFCTLCTCLPGFDTEDGPSRFAKSRSRTITGFQSVSGFNGVVQWAKDSALQLNDSDAATATAPAAPSASTLRCWAVEVESAVELTVWLLRCGFLNANVFGVQGPGTLPQSYLKGVTADWGREVGNSRETKPLPLSSVPHLRTKLLPHIWSFLRLLSLGSSFHRKVLGGLSDEECSSVVSTLLGTLEAITSLITFLVERYPAGLWGATHPSIQALHPHQQLSWWAGAAASATAESATFPSPRTSSTSAPFYYLFPVLSRELYTVAARLLLSPTEVFGEAAVGDAALSRRIRECGVALVGGAWEGACKVECDVAASGSRGERSVAAACMGAVATAMPATSSLLPSNSGWWLVSTSTVQDILLEDLSWLHTYVRGLRSLCASGPSLESLRGGNCTGGALLESRGALLTVVQGLISAPSSTFSCTVRSSGSSSPTSAARSSSTSASQQQPAIRTLSVLSVENANDPARAAVLRELCSLALDHGKSPSADNDRSLRNVSSQLLRILFGFSDPGLVTATSQTDEVEVSNRAHSSLLEEGFLMVSHHPHLDPNIDTLPPDQEDAFLQLGGLASSSFGFPPAVSAPLVFVPAVGGEGRADPSIHAPSQSYLLGVLDLSSTPTKVVSRTSQQSAAAAASHASASASPMPLLSRGSIWMKLFSKDVLHFCTKHAAHFVPTIAALMANPDTGDGGSGPDVTFLVQRDIAQQLLVGICERLSMSYWEYYCRFITSSPCDAGGDAVDPLVAVVSNWDRFFDLRQSTADQKSVGTIELSISQLQLRARLAKMLLPLHPTLVGCKLAQTCLVDSAYVLGVTHTAKLGDASSRLPLGFADSLPATIALDQLLAESTLSTMGPIADSASAINALRRLNASESQSTPLPLAWMRRHHLLSNRKALVGIKNVLMYLKLIKAGSVPPTGQSADFQSLQSEVAARRAICGAATNILVSMMRHFVADTLLNELPLSPEEELDHASDQYSIYHDLMRLLLLMLRNAPSPSADKGAVDMLFELLPLVRHQLSSAPLFAPLNRTLASSIRAMSGEGALYCIEECFSRLSGGLPTDIREAVCYRILLPALRAIRTRTLPTGELLLKKVAVQFIGTLIGLADGTATVCGGAVSGANHHSNISDAAADALRNVLTIRACAFSVVETLYMLLPTDTLKGPVNIAFTQLGPEATGSGKSQVAPKGTELTGKLVRTCQEAMKATCDGDAIERTASTDAASDSLELDPSTSSMLAFRQAAYACLVAVSLATQSKEDTLAKLAFGVDTTGDQWRSLVDRRFRHRLGVVTSHPQVPLRRLLQFTDWEVKHGVVGNQANEEGDDKGRIAGASSLEHSGLGRMSRAVSGYLSSSSLGKLLPPSSSLSHALTSYEGGLGGTAGSSDGSSEEDNNVGSGSAANGGDLDAATSHQHGGSHHYSSSLYVTAQSQPPLSDDPIRMEQELLGHSPNSPSPGGGGTSNPLTPSASVTNLTPAPNRPPSPSPQTPQQRRSVGAAASATGRASAGRACAALHCSPSKQATRPLSSRIYDLTAALQYKVHVMAEAYQEQCSQRMVMQERRAGEEGAVDGTGNGTINSNKPQSHAFRLDGEEDEEDQHASIQIPAAAQRGVASVPNSVATSTAHHDSNRANSNVSAATGYEASRVRGTLVDVDDICATAPFTAVLRVVNAMIEQFPTGSWALRLLHGVFSASTSSVDGSLPEYRHHPNVRLVFCKLLLVRSDYFFSTDGPLGSLATRSMHLGSSSLPLAVWRHREALFADAAIHCLSTLTATTRVSSSVASLPSLGKGVHYMLRDLCTALLHAGLGLGTPLHAGAPQLSSGSSEGGLSSPFFEQLLKGTLSGLSNTNSRTIAALAAALTSNLVRNVSDASNAVVRENLQLLRDVLAVGQRAANSTMGATGIHVSKSDLLGWLTYDADKTVPPLPTSLQGDATAVKTRHAEVVAKTRMGRMCGVQVCGVIASLGIPLYVPRNDSNVVKEEVFYALLLQNLTAKGGSGGSYVSLNNATAEVVGMALKALQARSVVGSDLCRPLLEVTTVALGRLLDSTKADSRSHGGQVSPLVAALRRIGERFPRIVTRFMHPVGSIFSLGSGSTSFVEMTASDQVRVLELLEMWLVEQGVVQSVSHTSPQHRNSGGTTSDSGGTGSADATSQVSGTYGAHQGGGVVNPLALTATPADDLYPSLQTQFSSTLRLLGRGPGGEGGNTGYTGQGVDAAVETALFTLLDHLLPTLSTHYLDELVEWFIKGMMLRIRGPSDGGGRVVGAFPVTDTRVAFYRLCIAAFNTLSARGGETARRLAEQQQREHLLASYFGGSDQDPPPLGGASPSRHVTTNAATTSVGPSADKPLLSEDASEGDKVVAKHLPVLMECLHYGLSDPAPFVQDIILAFWNHPSRMPSDTALSRLTSIYHHLLPKSGTKSAGTDSAVPWWLHHASILMLYLSHQSLDFAIPGRLVEAPLSASAAFFPVTLSTGFSTDAAIPSSGSSFNMRPMFSSQIPVRRLEKVPASLGGYAPRRFEMGGHTQGEILLVSDSMDAGDGPDQATSVGGTTSYTMARSVAPSTQRTLRGGRGGIVVPSVILNPSGGPSSVATIMTQGARMTSTQAAVPGRLLSFGGNGSNSGGSFSTFESVLSRRQFQPHVGARGVSRYGGSSQQDIAGGYGGYTSSLLFNPAREPSARFSAPRTMGAEMDDSVSQRGVGGTSSPFMADAQPTRRRFRQVGAQHQTRQHILHASRIREEARVAVEMDRQRKRHSVLVFRQYRAGEVPDVQSITQQSLVVPLQAVCLYDSLTAQIVSSVLSEAVFDALRNSIRLGAGDGTVATRTSPSTAAAPPSLFQTTLGATVGGAAVSNPQAMQALLRQLTSAWASLSPTIAPLTTSASTSSAGQEREQALLRRVSSATANTLLSSTSGRPFSSGRNLRSSVAATNRRHFVMYLEDALLSNAGVVVEIAAGAMIASRDDSPLANSATATTHTIAAPYLRLEAVPLPSEVAVFDVLFGQGTTSMAGDPNGGIYLLECMAALRMRISKINRRVHAQQGGSSMAQQSTATFSGFNLLFKAIRSTAFAQEGSSYHHRQQQAVSGYESFAVGPQVVPGNVLSTVLNEWPHLDKKFLSESTVSLRKSLISEASRSGVEGGAASDATLAACGFAEEYVREEEQRALCRMLRWEDATDMVVSPPAQMSASFTTVAVAPSAIPYLLSLGFSEIPAADTHRTGSKSSRQENAVPLAPSASRPTADACLMFLRAHARSLLSATSEGVSSSTRCQAHDVIVTCLLVAAAVVPPSLSDVYKRGDSAGAVLCVSGNDAGGPRRFTPPSTLTATAQSALSGLAIEVALVLLTKRRITACAEWCQGHMSSLLVASSDSATLQPRQQQQGRSQFLRQLQQLSSLTVIFYCCKCFLSLQRTKQAARRAKTRNITLQQQQDQLRVTLQGASNPFVGRASGRLAGASALLGGSRSAVESSFFAARSGLRSDASSTAFTAGGGGSGGFFGASSAATLMSLFDTMDAAAANPLADPPVVFSRRISAMISRWANPILRAALHGESAIAPPASATSSSSSPASAATILTDPLVWNELITAGTAIAQTCEIALSVGKKVNTFSDVATKCKNGILEFCHQLSLGAVQCLSRQPYAVPAAAVLIMPLIKQKPPSAPVTAAVHSLTLSQRMLQVNHLAALPVNRRRALVLSLKPRAALPMFDLLSSQIAQVEAAESKLGAQFALQTRTLAQHLFVQAASLLPVDSEVLSSPSYEFTSSVLQRKTEYTARALNGFGALLTPTSTSSATSAAIIPQGMLIGKAETARTYLEFTHNVVLSQETSSPHDAMQNENYWPVRRTFVLLTLRMLADCAQSVGSSSAPFPSGGDELRALLHQDLTFNRANFELARHLFPKVLDVVAGAASVDAEMVAIWAHFCGSSIETCTRDNEATAPGKVRISLVAVLPWCAQVLSYLAVSTTVAKVVWPLVNALASAHPTQLVYPYLTARDALLQRAGVTHREVVSFRDTATAAGIGAKRPRIDGAGEQDGEEGRFLIGAIVTLDVLLVAHPTMRRILAFRQGVDNVALFPFLNRMKALLRGMLGNLKKLVALDTELKLERYFNKSGGASSRVPNICLSEVAGLTDAQRIKREELTKNARDEYERFVDCVLLGRNCLSSTLEPPAKHDEKGHFRRAHGQQWAADIDSVVPCSTYKTTSPTALQNQYKDELLMQLIGRPSRATEEKPGENSVSSRLVPYVTLYHSLEKILKDSRREDTTGSQDLRGLSSLLVGACNDASFYDSLPSPSAISGVSSPLPVPAQPSVFFTTHPDLIPGITQVAPKALVLSSLQRPVRITMYASNERNYMLLVKGGDDLRTDERVQSVYWFVNRALLSATGSAASGRLRGYSVVPFSTSTGVIEWLPSVEPLEDFIKRGVRAATSGGAVVGSAGELLSINGTDQAFARLRSGVLPPKLGVSATAQQVETLNEVPILVRRGVVDEAKVSLLDHSATRDLSGNSYCTSPNTHATPWAINYLNAVASCSTDYLRAAFTAFLAQSPSEFFVVRQRYAINVGVLSLVNYLLGVGDRHLKNHLVDLKTGDIVSIDFGHLFASAVSNLPVAELVPFRMTPQMVGVLGIFGCRLLEGPMTHVLQVVRSVDGPFRTILSSFLREPLSAWQSAEARTHEQKKRPATAHGLLVSSAADPSTTTEVAPLGITTAEAKLAAVSEKLLLRDPGAVLFASVMCNHTFSNLDATKSLPPGHTAKKYGRCLDGLLSSEGGSSISRSARFAMGASSVASDSKSSAPTGSSGDDVGRNIRLLLDIATDPEVLSRMYLGWSPGI